MTTLPKCFIQSYVKNVDSIKHWYIHKPQKVLESEDCMILWDFSIQTDKNLEHNWQDGTVIDKKRGIF